MAAGQGLGSAAPGAAGRGLGQRIGLAGVAVAGERGRRHRGDVLGVHEHLADLAQRQRELTVLDSSTMRRMPRSAANSTLRRYADLVPAPPRPIQGRKRPVRAAYRA